MTEQREPTMDEWARLGDAVAMIRAATDDRQALNGWLGSLALSEETGLLLDVIEVSSSIIRLGDQTDANGQYPTARQVLDAIGQSAQDARAMPPEVE